MVLLTVIQQNTPQLITSHLSLLTYFPRYVAQKKPTTNVMGKTCLAFGNLFENDVAVVLQTATFVVVTAG